MELLAVSDHPASEGLEDDIKVPEAVMMREVRNLLV